ncbi:conserved hypothetical protein [Beutenbergia cavernae DSM 12333]|uniref:VanZ family protein n=1 Tax=Beutenbergia cavernae (strain ATCC BAA-8 / DSM 12333 / CCUG 43141 / JCM 11478 / NBRC 16432 / NCIMB 13614 / HKI 0122) TaxID=471853 RepID=C5C1T0_BEUC1|nr:conserved hypothetical protein [Beutenbergia cavernae DSM 12333]
MAFGVAVVVQLIALYAPSTPRVGPDIPNLDKLQHGLSFALVAGTGLLAGLRARWFVPVLLAHAVLSEVVQGAFLPDRSGDVADVVADVAGIAVGWALAFLVMRRRSASFSVAGPRPPADVR